MLTAGKRKSIESVDKISQFASSVLSVGEGAGEEAAASEAASKTSSKKASLASKRKSKKGSMAPRGSMAARKSRKSLAAPGQSWNQSAATTWDGDEDEDWDDASEAPSKTSSKKASLASKRKSKKKGSMAAPKGSMAARKSRKSLAAPGKSGIGKSGATVWEGDEEWDEETLLSSG